MDSVCFNFVGSNLGSFATLDSYLQNRGYDVWKRILNLEYTRDYIISELKRSCLRGRGGAGFPTAMKWGFIDPKIESQKYLVCNADEGEPGTCKDRQLLQIAPHQLIEGILIGCFVIGASISYVYVRGEYFDEIEILNNAIKEAISFGLLASTLDEASTIKPYISVHIGAGAYICGEETALLESLEGKRGFPRFKPPFPANKGLYASPTVINNVETLVSVPMILANGGEWFSKLGTEKSGGCKIFSISGHVNRPGNYELPLGVPFKDMLEIAGGMQNDMKLKAVIPGGSSVPVLPASIIMSVNMDYESLQACGSMLGSGGVIVLSESVCMVDVLNILSKFYHHESCGQCTPCREGTNWISKIVDKIANNKANIADLELLKSIAKKIAGKTICALADAASMPVLSFINHFLDDFLSHINNKTCISGAKHF